MSCIVHGRTYLVFSLLSFTFWWVNIGEITYCSRYMDTHTWCMLYLFGETKLATLVFTWRWLSSIREYNSILIRVVKLTVSCKWMCCLLTQQAVTVGSISVSVCFPSHTPDDCSYGFMELIEQARVTQQGLVSSARPVQDGLWHGGWSPIGLSHVHKSGLYQLQGLI